MNTTHFAEQMRKLYVRQRRRLFFTGIANRYVGFRQSEIDAHWVLGLWFFQIHLMHTGDAFRDQVALFFCRFEVNPFGKPKSRWSEVLT